MESWVKFKILLSSVSHHAFCLRDESMTREVMVTDSWKAC